MAGLTDAQFATLQHERAKYGATVTPEEIGALLNATAWAYHSDPVQPLGLQRKNDCATFQPDSKIHIWNGLRFIRDGQHFGEDCLGAASVGVASPQRATPGPADAQSFVPAVMPLDDVSFPVRPPVPDPELAKLRAENARLTRAVADLSGQLDDVTAQLAALRTHPAYEDALRLARNADEAFRRAQRSKKKQPLGADVIAHFVWGYLLEARTAEEILADAYQRGSGA